MSINFFQYHPQQQQKSPQTDIKRAHKQTSNEPTIRHQTSLFTDNKRAYKQTPNEPIYQPPTMTIQQTITINDLPEDIFDLILKQCKHNIKIFYNLSLTTKKIKIQMDNCLRNNKTLSTTEDFLQVDLKKLTKPHYNNLFKFAKIKTTVKSKEFNLLKQIDPKDFSNLHLCLNKLSLNNFSEFQQINTVSLIRCYNVSDVSQLGTVENLILIDCVSIQNVSCLSKVKKLTLSNLIGVSDVSQLGTVEELILCELEKVSDVSKLGTVKNLTLNNMINVSDVSQLGTVGIFNLIFCQNVVDVSPLATVKQLKIDSCYGVEDVSSLKFVEHLTLRDLRIYDVSMLTTVKTLNLIDCFDIVNVSMLLSSGNILNVINCENISD